jgi:hypothetical protein
MQVTLQTRMRSGFQDVNLVVDLVVLEAWPRSFLKKFSEILPNGVDGCSVWGYRHNLKKQIPIPDVFAKAPKSSVFSLVTRLYYLSHKTQNKEFAKASSLIHGGKSCANTY